MEIAIQGCSPVSRYESKPHRKGRCVISLPHVTPPRLLTLSLANFFSTAVQGSADPSNRGRLEATSNAFDVPSLITLEKPGLWPRLPVSGFGDHD